MKRWIHASSEWDLGWSKRADADGNAFYVMRCPIATASVEKDKDGSYCAEIKFRNGRPDKFDCGYADPFDAMDWAQKIIHEVSVNSKSSIKASSRITDEVQEIIDQVANKYELLYTTPMEDYVLKGDSFAFKVNGGNVYRVIIDARDNRLYFQCIEEAWHDDDGRESYDMAVDYKDEVVDYADMFNTIVRWVNECEADDPNYTKYYRYDENGEPIEESTKITASDDILPFKEIQEGMKWSSDWHDFEVIKVVPHKSCVITEDWIAEDSGKECHEELKCAIGVDNGEEYAYIPGNDYWKLYSTGALNFPYDIYLAQSQGSTEYLGDTPYDYDDDYTPSATAGDYSPSNPWDAPGMSIKDFI